MREGNRCSARVPLYLTTPDEIKLAPQSKHIPLHVHFLNIKPLLAQLLETRLNIFSEHVEGKLCTYCGHTGYTCDPSNQESGGQGGGRGGVGRMVGSVQG